MPQSPTIIAQSGPLDGTAYTAAVNAALATAQSGCFGPIDPANQPATFNVQPGFLWWDTTPTPDELKVRNAANDGWVTLLKLDGAAGPTLQAALDAKLALAGGTLTGFLTLHANPTSNLHAATKQYVDAVSRPAPLHFTVQGTAGVATKLAQVVIPQACNAVGAELYADTAPTGAGLIVTFTRRRAATADDSRTATIAAGQNAVSATFGSPMALQVGDRIRLDISQVGSTVAGGNDLMATLKLNP